MPRQGAPEPPHTQILGSWIIINIRESQHEISEHTCALACAHTHIELLCIIGRKAQVNFWAFAPTFPCQAASYLCPAPWPHGLSTLADPWGQTHSAQPYQPITGKLQFHRAWHCSWVLLPSSLDCFLTAALTNCHKSGSGKQGKYIFLLFRRPKLCGGSHWTDIKVFAGLVSPQRF